MSNESHNKPVIGIIGGIGSGKSTAAAELAELGCLVVNADVIGHELLSEPAIQDQLTARWGERVVNEGAVNRPVLSEIVFSDPDELEALNAIVHPIMDVRIGQQIQAGLADESVPAVVLDAALILEAGWDKYCSCLIFVSAPEPARQERIQAQRNWTGDHFRRREKSQISLDIKTEKCDYIVDNSSTATYLREQVRQIFFRITHTAKDI